MIDKIDEYKLQVKYCHVLYNEENYFLAAVLAASLFESYIHFKTNSKYIKNKTSSLVHAIEELVHNKIWTEEELEKLRESRNDLVHGGISQGKNEKKEKIKSILDFLERSLFGKTIGFLNYFKRQNIKESLKSKNLLSPEKPLKSKKFEFIDENDFLNLYKVRDKFLKLKEILLNNKDLKSLGYCDASVSHVDGTSGYVWLSILTTPNKKNHKINNVVLSLLITPSSFRIYIDFGGKVLEERKNYFELFRDKIFLWEILSQKDYDDINIFDIEWYYEITKKEKLQDIRQINEDTINEAIQRAEKDYNIHETITWNKFLLGYIIPRGKISKQSILDKTINMAKLAKIIEQKVRE